LVCQSGKRHEFNWDRRWYNCSRNQCYSAERLYVWLSFTATFGGRLSRSIFKIAKLLPRLRVCELLQSPSHALGMAQFVLGRLFRSVRSPLLDGCVARSENRLSDEARCVEADRISHEHPLQRFNSLTLPQSRGRLRNLRARRSRDW
jgi:hypothetical protein